MDSAVPISFGAARAHALELPTATATAMRFPAGLALPAHEHARATIAVVLRGGFTEVSRREERECRPGTVLVEPAGTAHANRFGGWRTSVVTLSMSTADEGSAVAALASEPRFVRDPFAAASGQLMERELERPDDISPLAVEAWMLELLTHLVRATRDGGAPPWLRDARDYLGARFSKPIRIGDVADAVGVEPARLARTFRRAFNEPIATYLRRLRVTAAARSLAETGDSIASIAAAVGFADQSHLTRSFVRVLGTTPARYRAQRRQGLGWRSS
jgi:AraC family transcriptional regulator